MRRVMRSGEHPQSGYVGRHGYMLCQLLLSAVEIERAVQTFMQNEGVQSESSAQLSQWPINPKIASMWKFALPQLSLRCGILLCGNVSPCKSILSLALEQHFAHAPLSMRPVLSAHGHHDTPAPWRLVLSE